MDEQIRQILELVSQPAFFAEDDRVVWCNAMARSWLLDGSALSLLLGKSSALFSRWNREGALRFSLSIGGKGYDTTAQALDGGILFLANRPQEAASAVAGAASDASAALRKPLQNIMSAAESLFETLDAQADTGDAASRLNRAIYQLLRLCGQMSDGGRLLLHRRQSCRISTDVNRFFSELFRQAEPLVRSAGLRLELKLLPVSLRADIDTELLERALFNLLSNAMSYTPAGGKIVISLEKRERMLLVSVRDNGEGISPQVLSTLFERFAGHSLGDSRWGMGMGLPMVREIARLHGGELTVSPNAEGGTCVLFSLSLEPSPLSLHSPGVRYDYCGGLNHALVELSDVLDASLFDPKET